MYFLFPVHPFIHSLSLLPLSHKLTHSLFLLSFQTLSILSERKERESWELRSLAFPSLTLSLTHCFQSIKVQERGEKYFHLGFQFKVKLNHVQNLQTQINIIGKKVTIWREEEEENLGKRERERKKERENESMSRRVINRWLSFWLFLHVLQSILLSLSSHLSPPSFYTFLILFETLTKTVWRGEENHNNPSLLQELFVKL